ncbi:uncharacterized protein LOC141612334 [Silene latifolia]|uniref:uncharacterized protein LOC141612334 n=1 Tax=Silene latifolia TaxID=37657 RepID=UPI003D773614
MGALAPVTQWIPKDDFLLKKAIEDGASLESLAKGAVRFSRRFTFKELQDRWHALLYDPVISAEASLGLVEFERSLKSTKADNSKDSKCGDGKRKAESIRQSYYAMRKRICNEPLNHGDLNFLDDPNESCFINGAEGSRPKSMLGDPMSTHYELENANFNDFHHVFPDVIDSAPPCGTMNSTGEEKMLEDPIQPNVLHDDVARSNIPMTGNCSVIGQTGHSEEVPAHIFQAHELQSNAVCNIKGITCSGFGGNTSYNSSIPECETSYHHLQYASSPPTMPDWKSIEGISVPEIPGEVNIGRNSMQAGDPFCIPSDGDLKNHELHNHMSCADLKTDCTEGYFAELSDSLFNFTSDDDMLIIDGGKDVIAKTYLDGLSSLLLNSPDDHNEDTMPGIPELEEPAVVDEYQGGSPKTVLEEKINPGEILMESSSEFQMRMYAGTVNPEFPEFRNGVICCTLNTEDPEIPCNDHILLRSKPRAPSILRRSQSEANKLSFFGKDTTENTTRKETKQFGEPNPALHRTHSVDEIGAKFEDSIGEMHNGLGKSHTSKGGLCKNSLAVKSESSESSLDRQLTSKLIEKSGQGVAISNPQTGCGGVNQEGHTSITSSTIWNQEYYALESADPVAAEPCDVSFFSEDEQSHQSDFGIPHFSDVESMILDMDLGSDDQDSLCSTEVSKYQHDDAKRMIIRLEQNAYSFMQRTTASHGALAVLYGRHSKHYIKKQEVLIGRGTADVPVDIDLGREGRANKISRRQAIMKMENDGTFSVRNMGKCSIYVNSKEILHGQILALHSNCLIEIRGIPFIFEINPSMVKKYLGRTAQKADAKRPRV